MLMTAPDGRTAYYAVPALMPLGSGGSGTAGGVAGGAFAHPFAYPGLMPQPLPPSSAGMLAAAEAERFGRT